MKLADPLHGLGLNVIRGAIARIRAARPRQAADDADRHVVIAEDLAAEPDAARALGGQRRLFGDRHARGLAGHEFDAARRAPSVAAAGMQLIDVRFVLERENESFVLRYGKRPGSFDSQDWHGIGSVDSVSVSNCPRPSRGEVRSFRRGGDWGVAGSSYPIQLDGAVRDAPDPHRADPITGRDARPIRTDRDRVRLVGQSGKRPDGSAILPPKPHARIGGASDKLFLPRDGHDLQNVIGMPPDRFDWFADAIGVPDAQHLVGADRESRSAVFSNGYGEDRPLMIRNRLD